jgi:CrcB protein
MASANPDPRPEPSVIPQTRRRHRHVPPDPRLLAAVFAGGALGSLARAALADALPHEVTAWPWPTFIANLAGALLLGYVVTRLQRRLPPPTYRQSFLGTGICGGLTTFSTLQLELVRMLDAGAWGLALGYGAATLAAGFAAVLLATHLVRWREPVR